MDINTIRGCLTVIVLCAFIGLILWVCSSKRKKGFKQASLLPLQENSALEPFSSENTRVNTVQEGAPKDGGVSYE